MSETAGFIALSLQLFAVFCFIWKHISPTINNIYLDRQGADPPAVWGSEGFKAPVPYPKRHFQALGEAGRMWERPARGPEEEIGPGAWARLEVKNSNTHQ